MDTNRKPPDKTGKIEMETCKEEIEMETCKEEIEDTDYAEFSACNPKMSDAEECTKSDEDYHAMSSLVKPKSKKSLAKSKSREASDQAGNDGYYEVEDILDHIKVHGKTFFLVKWKNYESQYNSWEGSENLNCQLAISRYFRRSLSKYESLLKETKEKSLNNK